MIPTRTFTAFAALLIASAPQTAAGQEQEQAREIIAVADAVGAAEQEVDGRAFEVELDAEDGRQAYEVKVLGAEDRVYEVDIDAETGEVISREEEKAEGLRKRWLDTEQLDAVTGAKLSLAEIITNVESRTGAAVDESEIDTDDGRVVHEMELLTADGAELEVTVDARSGEVLEQETDD